MILALNKVSSELTGLKLLVFQVTCEWPN